MPIFEYHCEACNHEFEELVMKDGDVVRCPACGSDRTGKLLSCCRFKTGGDRVPVTMRPSKSSSSSASCSGGNCSTCH